MVAFINGDPGKSVDTLKTVQKLTDDNKAKGLKSFVVFGGGPELKVAIEKVTTQNKITIPVTFLPGGPGASDYKAWNVDPAAKNAVILYSRRRLVDSMTDVNAEGWANVQKKLTEMLGG